MVCVPELGVTFTRPRDIAKICGDDAQRREYWRALLGDSWWGEHISGLRPSYLYYGSEFCENLIPKPFELERALSVAKEMGVSLVLNTPIASTASTNLLKTLFELLPAEAMVVANDWGVVYLLSREYPKLSIVGGRLLTRMVKDPRINGHEWAAHCGPHSFSGGSKSVLKKFRFSSFEVDMPIHVGSDFFGAQPFPIGVHLPYNFVAKGRICRVGSISLKDHLRFSVGQHCKKECLTIAADMVSAPGRDAQRITTIGNTIFSQQTDQMLRAVLDASVNGAVNRLIVPGEVQ